LEADTRAIIQGGEFVAREKGDLSIEDYLEKQDPMTIPPMFHYIDNQGSRWFLGASYADVQEQDAEVGDDAARLGAYRNCYMSLFMSTTGKESLRNSAIAGKAGTIVDDTAIAKTVQAGFSAKSFGGASPKANELLNWPLQQPGRTTEVRMYVVGVDAVSMRDMLQNEADLTAAAVRSYQNDNFLKGRDDAFKQAVERSKNDPAAYQRGAASAKSDLDRLQSGPAKPAGASNPTNAVGVKGPGTERGKIAPGQRVTPGKVKDDF
jgi:hypothetical protein